MRAGVRRIAAGDKQDEAYCGEKEKHQRAYRAENLFCYRFDECGLAAEHEVVVQRLKAGNDGTHLCLSVFHRHTGSETSERVDAGLVAVGTLLGGEGIGNPQLGVLDVAVAEGEIGFMGISEAGRHDANDAIGLAVERDAAIQNIGGACEESLPE